LPQFTVDSIRLPRDDGDLENVEQQGVPHLRHFLDHIAHLQSGKDERYGRRYQLETVQRGSLLLPSPYTGEVVSATRSFLVSGKIFYWFSGAPDFYVASSRISRGYPLAALVLPAEHRMLRWEPLGSRGLDLRHLDKLIDQRSGEAPLEFDGSSRVMVVMGNRNFAHHLWNELSALDRLVSKYGQGHLSDIFINREPLGDVERMFPEIAGLKIHRARGASMPDGLYVNLGSYCISKSMRGRLLKHARREASSEVNALISRIKAIGGPVFWLSVRMQNPTLENQREVMVAICRRLLNLNVRCSILMDGFSLPEDWSTAGDTIAESYRASADTSRAEIDAIVEEVSRTSPWSRQLVVNIGGIRLLDTIALAELADAYFCHGGSVQHKIGWTANKPGIIHGPRKLMSKDPISWHSDRLEGAVPPLPLPIQMIQDVESDLREKNYRVKSGAVAQFVANYFSYHVRH
jgi:hypothetical protein